ncbi:transposase [Dactylosporangium sp. NPDC050588]|uniref:transposase n=1 Tax=Dactylosporangium sp. NPDC050588 TaxID=3157211 RepID=UPI003409E593
MLADESGICLTPSARRTWAPRGRTPTVRAPARRTWLSLLACICYRPDRGRVRLAYYARRGSWNTAALIEVLPRLRRFLHGEPTVLVWDSLAAHHSGAMLRFLATQRDWLRVEALPSYAPELNPTELVWGNLKATELVNLCPEHIDEADTAHTGLHCIGSSYDLCFNFLTHAGPCL